MLEKFGGMRCSCLLAEAKDMIFLPDVWGTAAAAAAAGTVHACQYLATLGK